MFLARTQRRVVLVVTLAAIGAACSSGDDDAAVDDTVTPAATTAAPVATEPMTPATEPTTTPVSTAPPTTAPPTTTSTTTTLPPTTTTEPLAIQELLLRGDGFGSAVFGAAPEGVIDYVTSILGGNTGDTGWVDPFTYGICDGTIARKVSWGVLDLHFGDLSTFAIGRRHFHGWDYGLAGEIGNEPVGLRTPGGVTLGSRVVDLTAEFADAAINAEQPEINSPSNFYVSDNFWGLLTGTAPDDVITVMFGGYGCSE